MCSFVVADTQWQFYRATRCMQVNAVLYETIHSVAKGLLIVVKKQPKQNL